jgi:peptide/nickel transport system ATP-binding protein
MAFACRPSLIVLDEPTTGLDVSTQRHVLDTVRSPCRSHGVAAVYVSHDLPVVSGLVTQVAVMYAGRIVELGPTTALFSEPLHPYARGLIAAIPSSERAGLADRGAGCSFAARCGYVTADCRTRAPRPVSIAGREVRCLRVDEIQGEAAPHRPIPAARADGQAGPQALSVQILEQPADPYTRQLMEDVPKLAVSAAGAGGE